MAPRAALLPLLVAATLLTAAAGREWSDAPDASRTPAARPASANVVWVFFDHDAAASDAPAALSDDARAARIRRGVGTFPDDAPIPDALIAQVESTGAVIRERSRWLRAVSVSATAESLTRLRALPNVRAIRPVAQLRVTAAPGVRAAPAMRDSSFYGPNYAAIRQLGIEPAQQLGYIGTGIRIAILDTGFELQHDALNSRIVIGQRDFINHDNNVANQASDTASNDQERHGTQVWSLLGGYLPGILVGPAYGAQFLLAKVDAEPGDTHADEDRWVAAVEWADSLGAQIISSSVAFRYAYIDRGPIPFDSLDGNTTVMTRQADEAARRGILIVQAMGDAPTADRSTLSAPADADSIISVGAVDRAGQPAQFSPGFTARGPTADGRTKPEVVALGTGLLAAASSTRVGFDIGLAGTSYATPLIAGGAAMFMQAWPGLSAMAVRRALQLAGSAATQPDNTTGWGVPDISAAILFPEGISLGVLSPIDLTGSVMSVAPTFSWITPLINSVMRPVTYHVQVATDAAFTSIIFEDTVREASSLAARSALPPAPTLFWRVVATTPMGVTRTSLHDQFRVPAWVQLQTLAGDQPTFSTTTQPQLTWLPLDAPAPIGPFTYDVEVINHTTNAVVQRITNLTTPTARVTEPLTPNQSFRWRVIAHTRTGQVDTVASVQPFVVATDDRPPATILYQNFPNPFPRLDLGTIDTRIWFDLAQAGPVTLTVHDTRGRVVRRLIPAPGCAPVTLAAGVYGRSGQVLADENCILLHWDGTDDSGEKVGSGVYILRLQTTGAVLTKKMLYTPNRQVP
jgi:hypothetical protein